jgi:riboflavin transporter FmnP
MPIYMNTKKLTLFIVFGALTIALNPAFTHIAFFAPFAQGLVYQIWEIPIVAAFLIVTPSAGLAISLLNTAALFAFFPGALPTGPFYNLAATLSMQAGIFVAYWISKRITQSKMQDPMQQFKPKWIAFSTATGITFRVVFMSILLYFALPQPYPIGYQSFGFTQALTIAYLPFAAFFNATLALYTIPIGYFVARTIKKNLRITL